MIVSYWDGSTLKQREATDEERREFLNWLSEKPLRILLTAELKAKWLRLRDENSELGNHPLIPMLFEYFRTNPQIERIEVGEDTHVYLDEIHPEHRAIIEKYSGIIEYK